MRGGPQEFPPELEVSQLAPWHSLEAGAGCLVTSQQAAPLFWFWPLPPLRTFQECSFLREGQSANSPSSFPFW